MHAFCLISATGTRRSRARAQQEMDQPPTLKTRRSNAVHTRRLAIRVSQLDRHLAALETERMRTVRKLHEELDLLHQPRNTLLASGQASSVRDTDCHCLELGQNTACALKALDSKRLADDAPVTPNLAVKLSTMNRCLPPISSGLKSSPETKERCGNVEGMDGKTNESVVEDTGNPMEASGMEEHCLANSTSKAENKKANVSFGRSSACRVDIPFAVDVPFTRGTIRRPSQSLLLTDRFRSYGGSVNGSHKQFTELSEPDTRMPDKNGAPSPQNGPQSEEVKIQESLSNPEMLGLVKEEADQSSVSSGHLKPEKRPQARKPGNKFSTEPLPAMNLNLDKSGKLFRPTSKSLNSRKSQKHCDLAAITNHKCGYFPCMKPSTYHSLGFHPDPSTHSWQDWQQQNACRPHHRLVPGGQLAADVEERRTPADAPGYMKRKKLGREEVVRMDMARKKHRHALARPPSWNTNYGLPTPYKHLKNPVRLKPLL